MMDFNSYNSQRKLIHEITIQNAVTEYNLQNNSILNKKPSDNLVNFLLQLEQLERLHFEIPPAASWLPY